MFLNPERGCGSTWESPQSWAPVASLSPACAFLSKFHTAEAVRGQVWASILCEQGFNISPCSLSHVHIEHSDRRQLVASAHLSACLFKSLLHEVCEELFVCGLTVCLLREAH